jgi:hypothetical protein
MIKKTVLILIALLCCNICFSAGNANDKKLLKQAWKKYDFREFKAARNIFTKVQNSSKNKEAICQAKTGLAFYYQFGQRGNVTVADFERAIDFYEECIKIMGPDFKLTPFWKTMTAECLYRIYAKNDNFENLEKAQAIWQEIEKKHHGSLIAQDAMLFRTVIPTRDFLDEKTPKRILELEEYLKPLTEKLADKNSAEAVKKSEEVVLAGVMANYLGKLYSSRKEFKKSTDNFQDYVNLGATSNHYKLSAYYSIARIADIELKDKKLARKFYIRLYTESPTNRKAYLSKKRAQELGEIEKPEKNKLLKNTKNKDNK